MLFLNSFPVVSGGENPLIIPILINTIIEEFTIEQDDMEDFLENINEFIKEFEVITFAPDVEPFTFLDQVTIENNVNFTYLGESEKLKIGCNEDAFQFTIK